MVRSEDSPSNTPPPVSGDRPDRLVIHVEGDADDADGRWRRQPPRRPGLAVPVVVALLVGAVAGYLAGTRQGAHAPDAGAAASPSVAPAHLAPRATGQHCAVATEHHLQVGVEVVNPSPDSWTLGPIDVYLPLPGLRVVSSGWGACGELGDPPSGPYPLGPGARTWIRVDLDVLVPCPAPLPVIFQITDARTGTAPGRTLSAGGFADLGDVPYPGCSTGPS